MQTFPFNAIPQILSVTFFLCLDSDYLPAQDSSPQPQRIISPFVTQPDGDQPKANHPTRNQLDSNEPYVPEAPITPAVSRNKTTDYQSESETAFADGEFVKASRAIEMAIAQDERNPRLAFFASSIYFARSDYVTSTYYLDRASRLLKAQNSSIVLGNLQKIRGNKDFPQQLAALEKFVESHPAAFDAKLLLAFYYSNENKTDTAAKLVEEVLQGWPENALALHFQQLFAESGSSRIGDRLN